MSRIGRKPVPVPANVKVVDRRLDRSRSKDRRGSSVLPIGPRSACPFDEASREIVVTRADDERTEPGAARPDPQPGRQHGPGRHQRLHEEAGDRRRRLPGAAEEGQHSGAPGRLRQPDRAGGARGRDRRRCPTRPTSRSAGPTSRRSASSPPTSARSVRPSRTRARASVTRARSSAARPARPSGRSNRSVGIGGRRRRSEASASARKCRGSSREHSESPPARADPPPAAAAPRPQPAFGTTERPRLAVFRSSKHIYAQVINDETGMTLVAASTLDPELKPQVKYGGNKAAATVVGKLVAERAKQAGIDKVCFDRRSYKYHGRVAARPRRPRGRPAVLTRCGRRDRPDTNWHRI